MEVTQTADAITLAVVDNGIGIPADQLERIFEPFTQVDDSTTRTRGGTGLGLAITKDLVERMGGAIAMTSEVGVGTSVRMTFPPAP